MVCFLANLSINNLKIFTRHLTACNHYNMFFPLLSLGYEVRVEYRVEYKPW